MYLHKLLKDLILSVILLYYQIIMIIILVIMTATDNKRVM